MTTKVISFGCKPPRENLDLIDSQISLGHRYYNKLIELHRKQMEDCENARRERFPAFAAAEQAVIDAEAEVVRIVDSIRSSNAKAKRKRATPEESAALTDAKARLKELRAVRKTIRAAIAEDAGLQEHLASIYAASSDAKKEARANCGVYWGTYQKVENAVESAIKKTKGPPRFARWSHDGMYGQVAVQVIGGGTWQEMLIGKGKISSLLRGEPAPCKRTSEKAARPWQFSLRVSSDENRKPIWASVMAYVSPRSMPEDAKIMGVALVRKPLAPHRMSDGKFHHRYDWSLQFTIRTNEEKPRATTGACGIDVGWRLMEDGSLRVAYLAGDDGYHEELRLPSQLVTAWGKLQSIQSIRDRAFDAILVRLVEWKQQQTTELPEWFAEAAKCVGQWKSKGRLGRLVDQWAESRIVGDDEIMDELQAWRAHDVHLWQWQVDGERKAQRQRLDLYRVFAHRVSQRYGSIFVEDFDLRAIQRDRKPDDNTADAGAKEYMRTACLSTLIGLLKQKKAVEVEPANTTKRCHACGSIEEWDHARDLWHTCENCKLPWDQDYNGAKNILASGLSLPKTPEPLAGNGDDTGEGVTTIAPAYVGRWKKRKDARSQLTA